LASRSEAVVCPVDVSCDQIAQIAPVASPHKTAAIRACADNSVLDASTSSTKHVDIVSDTRREDERRRLQPDAALALGNEPTAVVQPAATAESAIDYSNPKPPVSSSASSPFTSDITFLVECSQVCGLGPSSDVMTTRNKVAAALQAAKSPHIIVKNMLADAGLANSKRCPFQHCIDRGLAPYARSYDLAIHLICFHLKISPYQCNQCGGAYSDRANLTSHQNKKGRCRKPQLNKSQ
jgi:hypothetical protein